MKCSICGTRNKNSAIQCKFCGCDLTVKNQNNYSYDNTYTDNYNTKSYNKNQINNVNESNFNGVNKMSQKGVKIILVIFCIIFLAPFIMNLLGVIVIFFFSDKIEDTIIKHQSVTTTGTLISYDNCYYDINYNQEFCNATYEYYVDGNSYTITSEKLVNKTDIDTITDILYISSDPSDAILKSEYNPE